MKQEATTAEEAKTAMNTPEAAAAPESPGSTPQEQKAATPSKSNDKFVSTGWKIHNEVTYRGVDWLLNSAIAVGFAYLTKQTERGQRWFTRPIEGFFSKLLKPVLKPENLKSGSEWGAAFISIMAGGTMIIPVMMGLENKKNKKGIIRWLDKKIYGKEEVENNPKFEESYNRVDEEPKKNFGTGMAARFAVLLPMIAVTVSPLNNYIKKGYYDYISKSSKFLSEKIGIKPKSMQEIATGGVGTKWDYLHQTIGFDLGLTFIYSFCHEFAYKALAALGFKKHVDTQSAAPQNAITSAVTAADDLTDIAYDIGHVAQSSNTNYASKVNKAAKVTPKSLTERAVRSEQEATVGV